MFDGKDSNVALNSFLYDIRNLINAKTGKTPSELQIGRKVNRFEVLNKVIAEQSRQRKYFKGKIEKEFNVNEIVFIKNYSKSVKSNWFKAKIERKISNVIYVTADADDRKYIRHVNQIRRCYENSTISKKRSNVELVVDENKKENIKDNVNSNIKDNVNSKKEEMIVKIISKPKKADTIVTRKGREIKPVKRLNL